MGRPSNDWRGTVFVVDHDESARGRVLNVAAAMDINFETYDTAEEYLAARERADAGCLLAEMRLVGMNGLEFQRHLLERDPVLPLILFTAHAQTAWTVEAIRRGAFTVLDKTCSEQDLWDTICQALQHNRQQRCVQSHWEQTIGRFHRLSVRERQVLDLIAVGRSNKAIARTLRVSIRTIETTRQQIFRKTETSSVAELVRVVTRMEVIASLGARGIPYAHWRRGGTEQWLDQLGSGHVSALSRPDATQPTRGGLEARDWGICASVESIADPVRLG